MLRKLSAKQWQNHQHIWQNCKNTISNRSWIYKKYKNSNRSDSGKTLCSRTTIKRGVSNICYELVGVTWSIWDPMLAPAGFLIGPKIYKKGVLEIVLKTHNFRMDFGCQDGRPWGGKNEHARAYSREKNDRGAVGAGSDFSLLLKDETACKLSPPYLQKGLEAAGESRVHKTNCGVYVICCIGWAGGWLGVFGWRDCITICLVL